MDYKSTAMLQLWLRSTLMVFMGLGYNNLYGQEQPEGDESEQHEIHARLRLAVAIGQTHIPAGNTSEDGRSFLVVPTWALGYFSRFGLR